jgi:protein TonB
MKIVFNNSQKLDEIVFARRNKSYGAYALRAGYNSAILKSLTIVSSTVFLFALGTYVFSKLNKEIVDDLTGQIDSTVVIPFENFPEKKDDPKPTEHKKTSVAPKADPAATKIIDSAEARSTPVNNEIVNNGTANGDPNASSGTATTGVIGDPLANITPTTAPEPPTAIPAEDPEFEGGLKALREFIANNIVYPGPAREVGQEGTVYVSFVIDEKGVVESSKVLKGIGYGCDEESMRVINKIPKFKKPGKNRFGIPVKTIFNIPIAFRLRN